MNEKMQQLMKRAIPALRDVVGLDFGSAGVKAVRIRADGSNKKTVVAADLLPYPDNLSQKISLPKRLAAPSAALTMTSLQAVVKLAATKRGQTLSESDYAEVIGLPKENDFRIAATHLNRKDDEGILIAAIPENEVENLFSLFPVKGPQPVSLEISGLAAIEACRCGCKDDSEDGCDLVVDAGESVTTVSVLYQGEPYVVRRFNSGVSSLLNVVSKKLGCEEPIARDIVLSGDVDVSAAFRTVFGGCLRQAGIAVDFTERRTGARLRRILLVGGLANNVYFQNEFKGGFGMEPSLANPWQTMMMTRDTLKPETVATGVCFAAATGAALAYLEDEK